MTDENVIDRQAAASASAEQPPGPGGQAPAPLATGTVAALPRKLLDRTGVATNVLGPRPPGTKSRRTGLCVCCGQHTKKPAGGEWKVVADVRAWAPACPSITPARAKAGDVCYTCFQRNRRACNSPVAANDGDTPMLQAAAAAKRGGTSAPADAPKRRRTDGVPAASALAAALDQPRPAAPTGGPTGGPTRGPALGALHQPDANIMPPPPPRPPPAANAASSPTAAGGGDKSAAPSAPRALAAAEGAPPAAPGPARPAALAAAAPAEGGGAPTPPLAAPKAGSAEESRTKHASKSRATVRDYHKASVGQHGHKSTLR